MLRIIRDQAEREIVARLVEDLAAQQPAVAVVQAAAGDHVFEEAVALDVNAVDEHADRAFEAWVVADRADAADAGDRGAAFRRGRGDEQRRRKLVELANVGRAAVAQVLRRDRADGHRHVRQRLVAPSDPQVEFAACIKKNLGSWEEQTGTGEIDRQMAHLTRNRWYDERARGFGGPRPMVAFSAGAFPSPPMMAVPMAAPVMQSPSTPSGVRMPARANGDAAYQKMETGVTTAAQRTTQTAPTATPMLAKMRLQFPEIIYNNIVRVQEQASVEVTLGDSMTRYSIEAFALAPETLDWQRVETTLDAVQPVFGELTVSPFVFPGDPVMGRLDVGAASGGAIVEVRHDGEVLPLFFDNGDAVTPGLPVPSGSVLRFPVRPGAITSTVRDARKAGIDVSERYVTEPGKLRHIMRRLHLLTPGDEVTLQEQHRLEIKPVPGLEKPFQFFVEGAAKYPFG